MRSTWFGILLVVPLTTIGGCGDGPCTRIGCNSGAKVTIKLPFPASDLPRTTITVCHNGKCSSGVGPEPDRMCQLQGEARVGFCHINAQSELALHIAAGENPQDGDRYVVTVTQPGSSVIAVAVDQPVTYTRSQPNGPGCPPICFIASITN